MSKELPEPELPEAQTDFTMDARCRNCVSWIDGKCAKRGYKETTADTHCSLWELNTKINTEKTKIQDAISAFIDMRDLAQQFIKVQPIYYDESKLWWIWDFQEYKWIMIDETDLLNLIAKASQANTIRSRDRQEIIEALKQVGRENKPDEIKTTWVQFKEKFIDIETLEKFEATPKYFATNPIPWSLGNTSDTPTLDKIFKEWVGPEYVTTLYQIIAYCLLPDYPINRLFCLMGEGMNGKSKYLELITRFIGISNCTSTELDLLVTSRFEHARLHKKLVCQMGETNFNEMKQTSRLKRLTGKDMIGIEYKNKDLFHTYNYAKILIATNNLPTTTDKTLGFYRRWLIIDFPNKFTEKKDILSDISDEEYQNLAKKSLGVLQSLLNEKEFHNEGTPEERGIKYEEKSNPFDKFMKEMVEEEGEDHIYKFEFRKTIDEWCNHNKFRKLSDSFIKDKLRERSISESRITVTEEWYKGENAEAKRYSAWIGIKWKSSVTKIAKSKDGDVKGVRPVNGVPLNNHHRELNEIGVTGLTGLTGPHEVSQTPSKSEGIVPQEERVFDDFVAFLKKNPSGDLEDLEKAVGIKMSQKLLRDGEIFEEKPGRYKIL